MHIPCFEKFGHEPEKIIETVSGGMHKETVKYVCTPQEKYRGLSIGDAESGKEPREHSFEKERNDLV